MSPEQRVIMLVERDPALARTYASFLSAQPLPVMQVDDLAALSRQLESTAAAAVIVDLHTTDLQESQQAQTFSAIAAAAPLIAICADGSVTNAVQAIRLGAKDYLPKPFQQTRLIETLERAIAQNQTSVPPAAPCAAKPLSDESGPDESGPLAGFVGRSEAMQSVYREIAQSAPSSASVFIIGESGTGKEVAAKAIHELSARAQGPFISLNCAAIPTELMESEIFGHVRGAFTGATEDRIGAAGLARGGTLFLDELCEMPLPLQAKLLRFVQDGSFTPLGRSKQEQADVRFVCATNRDPVEEVAAGRFRQDLYYRLHVLPIRMPPLRERGGDAVLLAEHFLHHFARQEGKGFAKLSRETGRMIANAPWPGNVRQLQNAIHAAVVRHEGSVLEPEMLEPTMIEPTMIEASMIGAAMTEPAPVLAKASTKPGTNGAHPEPDLPLSELARHIRPLAQIEREMIESAVRLCGGDVRKAAVLLEISPATIYRKQKSWEARSTAPAPVSASAPDAAPGPAPSHSTAP
ncbi:MAG: sigma-54-dependent Fis family transcriptional regulator [Neomegalonema sp.]|nr:sigma-54-dependent Fis family transcriptional regulator [Neomegalonema sp.]